MLWEALSAVRDIGRLHDPASVLIRYGFGDIVQRVGLGRTLERTGKALRWKYVEELPHSSHINASGTRLKRWGLRSSGLGWRCVFRNIHSRR